MLKVWVWKCRIVNLSLGSAMSSAGTIALRRQPKSLTDRSGNYLARNSIHAGTGEPAQQTRVLTTLNEHGEPNVLASNI
jgi:hypothetical protein